MEPKKNTQVDIHRHRGVFLNIGLIVSLVLVIMAFKMTQPLKEVAGRRTVDEIPFYDNVLDDPRVTEFKKDPAPVPQKIPKVVPIALTFKEIKDDAATEEKAVAVDMNEFIETIEVTAAVEPEVVQIDTFRVVETMPTPLGGWPAFYEMLSKNIKYQRHFLKSPWN